MDGHRKQIDTSVEIVTPENISFRYWVAGPAQRFPAWLIDVLVQALVLIVAAWCLRSTLGRIGLPGSSVGLFLMAFFLIQWFYAAALEALWNGQTLGKRAVRIRVVTLQGQPIRAWQAVLRNVLRMVDAMPLTPLAFGFVEATLPLFAAGVIAAALNDRFQRLGDLAAGTMVVVDDAARLAKTFKFRDDRVREMAVLIPASFQVSRTLGLALSLYVERRKALSRARRLEIARHLGEPLRKRFNLPAGDDDLLLCGLYQKAFVGSQEAVSAEAS